MNTRKRRFVLGTGAALFAMACWGTVPLFMKALTCHMNSWTMNMYRYGFAGLLYLPFIVSYAKRSILTKELFIRSLPPTVINIVGQVLWALSPYYLEPGIIGIFIKTSLIWSTACSLLFFADERPLIRKPAFWTGVVLTFCSIIAMSVSQLGSRPAAESGSLHTSIIGLTIILSCAVFWGLYPVSVKMKLKGVDPLLAFGLICINTAVGLTVLGIFFGNPAEAFSFDSATVTILLLSSVIGIALSHLTYYYALNTIGVITSTNITMITPFYTLLLSYLIFNESITAAKVIFGTGIITGVLIISIARQSIGKSDVPQP